jgi:hypothetical protein
MASPGDVRPRVEDQPSTPRRCSPPGPGNSTGGAALSRAAPRRPAAGPRVSGSPVGLRSGPGVAESESVIRTRDAREWRLPAERPSGGGPHAPGVGNRVAWRVV